MQIVGLVPDTKYHELREEFQPIIYLATSQQTSPRSATQIVIHSAAPLNDTIARLRRAIVLVSGEMTMDFQSFASTVAEGLIRERLMATLSTFFGVLATLIAAIGLYGVMSYMVARRTNEIGIRMALGAASGQILSLILRQSAGLLAIGLGVGTVISLTLAPYVESLLFGLRPHDAAP
jgi:ABC-type antimicrobial peptide transport system permease subunit